MWSTYPIYYLDVINVTIKHSCTCWFARDALEAGLSTKVTGKSATLIKSLVSADIIRPGRATTTGQGHCASKWYNYGRATEWYIHTQTHTVEYQTQQIHTKVAFYNRLLHTDRRCYCFRQKPSHVTRSWEFQGSLSMDAHGDSGCRSELRMDFEVTLGRMKGRTCICVFSYIRAILVYCI